MKSEYGLDLTYKELQCIRESVEVYRDHYKGWDYITPRLLEKIDTRIKDTAPEIEELREKKIRTDVERDVLAENQ